MSDNKTSHAVEDLLCWCGCLKAKDPKKATLDLGIRCDYLFPEIAQKYKRMEEVLDQIAHKATDHDAAQLAYEALSYDPLSE